MNRICLGSERLSHSTKLEALAGDQAHFGLRTTRLAPFVGASIHEWLVAHHVSGWFRRRANSYAKRNAVVLPSFIVPMGAAIYGHLLVRWRLDEEKLSRISEQLRDHPAS